MKPWESCIMNRGFWSEVISSFILDTPDCSCDTFYTIYWLVHCNQKQSPPSNRGFDFERCIDQWRFARSRLHTSSVATSGTRLWDLSTYFAKHKDTKPINHLETRTTRVKRKYVLWACPQQLFRRRYQLILNDRVPWASKWSRYWGVWRGWVYHQRSGAAWGLSARWHAEYGSRRRIS